MKIGPINLDEQVFVIAEVGNNHEGDFSLAKELVHLAADSGASAVMFQTIRADHFVAKSNTQRYEQIKKFELSDAQFVELASLANKEGILFMSTPFDLGAVDMLDPLVPAFKIASGDNNFFPLLERIASKKKPIVLSTGLTAIPDIRRALSCLERAASAAFVRDNVCILHCVASCPVPAEQANIPAVKHLRDGFNMTTGYSDHSLGPEAAVLAVALGARVIEKHFTIDKNHSAFRDHQLSADPPEMKLLVERVREADRLCGDGRKKVEECEIPGVTSYRRSIVAVRDLPEGHIITLSDLSWIRPGTGTAPGDESKLIGRKLKAALRSGEQLMIEQLC